MVISCPFGKSVSNTSDYICREKGSHLFNGDVIFVNLVEQTLLGAGVWEYSYAPIAANILPFGSGANVISKVIISSEDTNLDNYSARSVLCWSMTNVLHIYHHYYRDTPIWQVDEFSNFGHLFIMNPRPLFGPHFIQLALHNVELTTENDGVTIPTTTSASVNSPTRRVQRAIIRS